MARLPRHEVVDPTKQQVLHCTERCVRRAYLCGDDPYTGQSYEYRRGWIRDRFEFLASVFGIDFLTYAVMSNHAHVVLRTRPDIVASWTDKEVALCWLRLHPKRKDKQGQPKEPNASEIGAIAGNPKRLAEIRRRLSDVSWLMGDFAGTIARQSNREDGCTGHFWEGRFDCTNLLDEASLLACMMYDDLNPIRAAMAQTPETSLYTGAKDRIDDLTARTDLVSRARQDRLSDHEWERAGAGRQSGWLSPIELDQRQDPLGPDPARCGRRASDKGILPISLTEYLQLLDWTGRAIRADKRGSIPQDLAPILARLGLDADHWCEVATRFGKLFKRAAGTSEHLAAEARRRGQRWMQGPGARLLTAGSA